ncbi:hypothetical protein OTU49_009809, partial [Cherax quadricarinatus]
QKVALLEEEVEEEEQKVVHLENEVKVEQEKVALLEEEVEEYQQKLDRLEKVESGNRRQDAQTHSKITALHSQIQHQEERIQELLINEKQIKQTNDDVNK